MIDVSTLTANELVSKLRSGEISSVELCNKYLDRIKEYEKDIQAWAHLDKKILLEKADETVNIWLSHFNGFYVASVPVYLAG